MSPSPTSLLLIGFGRMGQIHLRELQAAQTALVVGVVDPRDLPELPLGCTHYRDLASALRAHPQVTAAIIATPDNTHFALAQQCLRAGLAVLLEKPACPTVAQALELDAAFARAGKPLLLGHCEQYQPVFLQFLRELPRIGNLLGLATVRMGPTPVRLPDSGVALDLAIHDLDLAMRIWEQTSPSLPTAADFRIQTHAVGMFGNTPSTLDATLSAPHFPPLQLRAAWGSSMRQRTLSAFGTMGSLHADLATGDLRLHSGSGPTERLPVAGTSSTIASEQKLFLQHVRFGSPVDNTLPLLALELACELSAISDQNIPHYRPPVTAFPWESLAFQGQSVVAL